MPSTTPGHPPDQSKACLLHISEVRDMVANWFDVESHLQQNATVPLRTVAAADNDHIPVSTFAVKHALHRITHLRKLYS